MSLFFRRTLADVAALNRHSRLITQPKDHGASQAMLYATDGIHTDADFNKPLVGVASVWYEGNPFVFFLFSLSLSSPLSRCNKHLLTMGQHVKASLQRANTIAYQFGTVGVSDGISMGTFGMAYSLQSRDLIADAVETATAAHHLDGIVVVPGCDKNMPGVLIARPSSFSLPSLPLALALPSWSSQPSRYHGLRWNHPPWFLPRPPSARHRLCFPILRSLPSTRQIPTG